MQPNSDYSATQQATILHSPSHSGSLNYRQRLFPISTLLEVTVPISVRKFSGVVYFLPANLSLTNPAPTVVYHSLYDSVQISVWFLSGWVTDLYI